MARYPVERPHVDFSAEDVERPRDYFSLEERETRRPIALLIIVGVLLMALAVLMSWPFA